jgi:glutamyl-tRNA reductase
MTNSFITIGLKHGLAPLGVLEKFHLSNDQIKVLISFAKSNYDLTSIIIVSTCNRTQLFSIGLSKEQLVELLVKFSNGSKELFMKFGFEKMGEAAIENLFVVSAGLDSQILGDLQIFSQVKKSVEISKSLQAIDSITDRWLQYVSRAYKEVQSTTKISKGAASVAHAAVLFVRDKYPNLTDKKILLFGAGELGKRILENIIKQDFLKVTIINKTREKATILADKHDVIVADLSDLQQNVLEADIVVVATSSSSYTIDESYIGLGEKLLIDLSLPRNINPNVRALKQVLLTDLDDLRDVADGTLDSRKADIPQVKVIIEKYKSDFLLWMKMRGLGATIKDIELAFEAEKEKEIIKYKGQYTEEELEKLHPIIDCILKRIQSKNIEYLKSEFEHDEGVVSAFRKMYSLDNNAP